MPNLDNTGPNGNDAQTGRGAGNGRRLGGAGNGRRMGGAGYGSGTGRGMGGRGQGREMGVNASSTQENSWLQTQFNNLHAAIEKLTERLNTSGK